MKISVIPGRCQGHARCDMEAPGLFPMDESGFNVSERLAVPAEREAAARRAVEMCPERALVIAE